MSTAELVGIIGSVVGSAVAVAAWVTWRVSKHAANLAELRRDVDRIDTAHTALAASVAASSEKQGFRVGQLERATDQHRGVCEERHKAPAGSTV